jgi:hypothetical protein
MVPGRGRGVFAIRKISKGETIERAPVIAVPGKEWKKLKDGVLSNYAFDWGEKSEHAAIALGYISIYNHSYSPNAKLEELPDELMMEIVALKDIHSGNEITINYNGEPGNRDELWFRVSNSTRRRVRKPRR